MLKLEAYIIFIKDELKKCPTLLSNVCSAETKCWLQSEYEKFQTESYL